MASPRTLDNWHREALALQRQIDLCEQRLCELYVLREALFAESGIITEIELTPADVVLLSHPPAHA